MSANSTSSRDSGPGGPARAPPGPLRDPNRFGGRHSARTGPHPRLGPSAIWPPPPSPGAVRKEAIPPPRARACPRRSVAWATRSQSLFSRPAIDRSTAPASGGPPHFSTAASASVTRAGSTTRHPVPGTHPAPSDTSLIQEGQSMGGSFARTRAQALCWRWRTAKNSLSCLQSPASTAASPQARSRFLRRKLRPPGAPTSGAGLLIPCPRWPRKPAWPGVPEEA